MKKYDMNEYYSVFSDPKFHGGPRRMNPWKEPFRKYNSFEEFKQVFPADDIEIARQEISFLDRVFDMNKYTKLSIFRFRNSNSKRAWFPKIPYAIFDMLTKDIRVTFSKDLFESTKQPIDYNTIKSQLTNSEFIPKIEWLKEISKLKDTVEKEVVNSLPLADWQIGEDGAMNGNSNIYIKVPDLENNVEIMNNIMEYYGYFLSYVEDWSMYENWKILNYEANILPKISSLVIRRIKKMYHVSPRINKKSILENGILPKSENAKFKYPPRVFLLADYETTGETVKEEDIKDVAKDLLSAKLLVEPRDENWFDWTYFVIDVSKLPKDTEFSYDPNLYPFSLFTVSAIPLEAIIKSVDFSVTDFD